MAPQALPPPGDTRPGIQLPFPHPGRDEIEVGWLASPPDPAEAFREADEALSRWVMGLPEVRDHRPLFVGHYWAARDRPAGLTH